MHVRRTALLTSDNLIGEPIMSAMPSELLREFHERPGVDIEPPTRPTLDVPNLDARVKYLREEVQELSDAVQAGDLVAVADALADITYVVYGTAWRTGIPLDAVLIEVHRSNMTKTPSPGDGKAIKGPDYSPPEVKAVLAAEIEREKVLDLPWCDADDPADCTCRPNAAERAALITAAARLAALAGEMSG